MTSGQRRPTDTVGPNAETVGPRNVSTIEHTETITTESAFGGEIEHSKPDSSHPNNDTQLSNEHLNIVILHEINTPGKYRSHKEIITEIDIHKLQLNVKHCYPLAGGGICLHLKTHQDKLTALETWPVKTFNGSLIQSHLPRRLEPARSVFIKNIPHDISEYNLSVALVSAWEPEDFSTREQVPIQK